jgi:stage II sporulation protein D
MGMRKLLILIFIYIIFALPSFATRIKIGLQTQVGRTYIGASTQAEIIDCNTNKLIFIMEKMKGYEFKPYRGVIAIKVDGEFKKIKTDKIIIKPEDNGFVSVKRKWYRGNFKIINDNGGLTVMNDLPLELYIRGVVPSEMPSGWEHEAHKAQAIAARSYALANLGKRGKYGYDLKDTPEDQAYGGATSETPQTTYAVLSTRGEVLTYDNKIIPAYYHASSGGKTVSAGDVWNHDLPYIQSVEGFDYGVRKKGHGVGMSQYGANNMAKRGFSAREILHYFYKDVNFSRLKTKEE